MMIKNNVSLELYNTFGIDVKARHFAEVTTIGQLEDLLITQKSHGWPLLILGGGSNFLFTQDFPGLVIKVAIQGINKIEENNEWVRLKIGAGENWHQLVLHCIEKGYGGIENLSLIPGTVGAAPIQNIGAYGVELQSVFHELTAVDLASGKSVAFSKDTCEFNYRYSIFKGSAKGKYLITDVTLQLSKHPDFNTSYGAIQETIKSWGHESLTLEMINKAVIHIRQSKLPDPAKIGNAGSFFKNPTIDRLDYEELKTLFPEIPGYNVGQSHIKIPAAWMIDFCGWKGKTIGAIGVHQHQALVLVNYGGGHGKDIKKLAMDIQSSVRETFGIELQPEVNIV